VSFVVLGAVTAVLSVLLALEWFKGEGWRRQAKIDADKESTQEKTSA
jgi:hypothetical protein